MPLTSIPRGAALGLDDLVGNELRLLEHLVVTTTHEALDGKDRVFGICDALTLCHLPDEGFPFLRERHHRRSQTAAFLIGDDGWVTASTTATTEFVVPRSMPITFAMFSISRRKSRVNRLGDGAERPVAGRLRYSTSILISFSLAASTFGSVTVSTPSR